MEPVKVQVRKGSFLCAEDVRLLNNSQLAALFPGVISEAFKASLEQTTAWIIPREKD